MNKADLGQLFVTKAELDSFANTLSDALRQQFVQFAEAHQSVATNEAAILKVLIDKGVVTQDEFDEARAITSAAIDQEAARLREIRGQR